MKVGASVFSKISLRLCETLSKCNGISPLLCFLSFFFSFLCWLLIELDFSLQPVHVCCHEAGSSDSPVWDDEWILGTGNILGDTLHELVKYFVTWSVCNS